MCPHCKAKDAKIVKRRWPDGRFDWMCSACGRQVEKQDEEMKELTTEKILTAIGSKGPFAKTLFPEWYGEGPAAEIGQLYRQAKTNFVDSVKLLIECGERLKAQKENLSHGEWTAWLEANQKELGFGDRTARMLMDAASRPFSTKRKLASDLTEEEALAVSRQIWGHREPTPSYVSEHSETSRNLEESPEPEPSLTRHEPKEEKPPSFPKPVMDFPDPPRLDNNPRRCGASCCSGETEIAGPCGRHDAQAFLDEKDFPHDFFGENHGAVLDILTEVYWLHAIAQFRGGIVRSAVSIPERRRYRGIGQGG
jgi:hypothetical protein